MKGAVMAGRHQHPDGGLVVHLGAIGAGVEPVLLGIAGDAVGSGADIPAAVELVPDRRGEFEHVDRVANHDVLEHRPGVDDLMGDDAHLLEIGLAVSFAELPFGEVVGEPERHVAARPREHVQQIEHDAGTALGAQDGLGASPMSSCQLAPRTVRTSPSRSASTSHSRRSS
jgi:hypothetical protein